MWLVFAKRRALARQSKIRMLIIDKDFKVNIESPPDLLLYNIINAYEGSAYFMQFNIKEAS